MAKYLIVVDYGKPYDIKVNSDAELKKELLKLQKIAEAGDYPFFDVIIYDDKDRDITDKMFKKLKLEY